MSDLLRRHEVIISVAGMMEGHYVVSVDKETGKILAEQCEAA